MLTCFFFFKEGIAGLKAEFDEGGKGTVDEEEIEEEEEGSEDRTGAAEEVLLSPFGRVLVVVAWMFGLLISLI